jgi:predicted RNase H-like nuclease (RuvC/YqgF family)
MKRNDPLPMLPPPIPAPITAPATSTDPAVLALQAANANMLEIINRHTQNADEHVALYARENGDLRKQNGELLERIAELQRQLMKCENNSSMLTTKVEVLQNRLDERERRG